VDISIEKTVTAFTHTPLEVGEDYYGFCNRVAKDYRAEICYMDSWMKFAYFIAISEKDSLEKLSKIYMEKIVRLYEVSASIISDIRDLLPSFWTGCRRCIGPR
jgi:hypothetical protein